MTAEDEVCRTYDEGFGVDLVACVCVESVLGAGELASVVALPGVLGAQSNCLYAGAEAGSVSGA